MNKHWIAGIDGDGLEYEERIDDGYRRYKLDKIVAERILELHKTYSWRRIAMAVTGEVCQNTGSTLVDLAEWTLKPTGEVE